MDSGLQYRRHKQLGVGVLWIVQDTVRQSRLDHMTSVHHHHSVRQQAGHGQIVRDDDDREAEPVHQPAQQIEQARRVHGRHALRH